MSTRLFGNVYRWLNCIQFALLPPSCLSCRKDTESQSRLCQDCIAALSENLHRCYLCALPLTEPGISTCGQCLSRPPPWCRTITAFTYALPVSVMIQQFKDAGKLSKGRFLSRRLGDTIMGSYDDSTLPDMLLPVPLHPSRMRSRGFNQSLEIGKELSRLTGVPLDAGILHCNRRTQNQKKLGRKERRQNLEGAFSLEGKNAQQLAGLRIALVDDVMTTGATAYEISRLLLRHRAQEVHVWTLARTDRH